MDELHQGAQQAFYIGKYRVEAEVGRGAMGTVYAARHPDDNSRIALKTLEYDQMSGDAEVALERFRREVMVTGALHHPGIVRVFEAGEGTLPNGKNAFFLAMELVTGETLHSALKRGSFVPEQASAVIVRLLDALNFVHGHGIVHRDVKPGNVFISNDRVVLVDFGICKIQDMSSVTHANAVMGTLPFMAPEQLLEDVSGPGADIFAAGSLFYTMLTRRYLRPVTTVNKILRSVQDGEDLRKIQKMQGFDPAIIDILERSLHPDPKQRYQSAREMMNELWPLAGELPQSGPKRLIPASFSGKVFDVHGHEYLDPDSGESETDYFDEEKPPSSQRKKVSHSNQWYRQKSAQRSLAHLTKRQHGLARQASGQFVLPEELQQGSKTIWFREHGSLLLKLAGLALVALLLFAIWAYGAFGAVALELNCDAAKASLFDNAQKLGPSPQHFAVTDRSSVHVLRCEAPGMRAQEKSWKASSWGRNAEFVFKLNPILVDVIVNSHPEGGSVVLNGAARCKTPCSLPKLKGEQKIIVEVIKDGYIAQQREVQTGRDYKLKLDFKLQRLRPERMSLLFVQSSAKEIFVDGQDLSKVVTRNGILLNPGQHTLRFGKTGELKKIHLRAKKTFWYRSPHTKADIRTSMLNVQEFARVMQNPQSKIWQQKVDQVACGAVYLLSKGRLRAARKRFAQVLKANPHQGAALRGMVLLAAQQRNKKRFINALNNLLMSGAFLDDSTLVRGALKALKDK